MGSASSRGRVSAATYRRRRLVALAAVAAIVVAAMAWIRSGGDGSGDFPPSAAEVRRAQLAADPVELTLSFSGDLLVHSPVYSRALALGGGDRYDFAPMLAPLEPYVRRADLAFCHVEVPMTPEAPSSYPIFNSPPSLARALAATGFDACDTASNHSLDQGEEGIAETLRALDRAGLEHTGSFSSPRERRRPLLLRAGGVEVALIAYTTDTNGIPPPSPHLVNVATGPRPILADARRARSAGADAVIVNVHWSANVAPEYVTTTAKAQEKLARRLLASDAVTAVVGQGPHVVQPIERSRDGYTVYSEGNLISNQGADVGLVAASQDGYVALLDLVVDDEGERVERVRYVPVHVSKPDYSVLPVGDALAAGRGDAAALRESYERTVSAVGRGRGVRPLPARLP